MIFSFVEVRHLPKLRAAPAVRDVINAVDFYLREESDFITGQVLYLGGIN